MKNIIINKNNLSESEITDYASKVKILLINSDREILLANSHNEYQFPGGTCEKGELLTDTVKRELMEEVGILIDANNLEPFIKFSGYYKDWPSVGRNKKVDIYYYEVLSNIKPNLEKINLTENEIEGNFKLEYILLDEIETVLENNSLKYGDPHGIAKEMIRILNIYKDI